MLLWTQLVASSNKVRRQINAIGSEATETKNWQVNSQVSIKVLERNQNNLSNLDNGFCSYLDPLWHVCGTFMACLAPIWHV
jgi:hypothetical protein